MAGDKKIDSGFTDEQLAVTYALVVTQSIIAIGFDLFIVFTFARFKELRKRSFELVFTLTCTSIMANIMYTLAPENTTGTPGCTAQGFFINFFDGAVIGWTTMIAYSLYCAVVLQTRSPSRLQMHGMVWTPCLVLSLLPLFTGSYGDSGPWCWIASHDVAGVLLRFVCFYIPLWLAFGLNAKIYYEVTQTLRRFAILSEIAASDNGSGGQAPQATTNKFTKMANNLRWYPIIFVASWSANTVLRVVQAFLPNYNSNYTFAVVHVVFHGTFYQSIGNTIAYGFNETVKMKWAGLTEQMRTTGSCLPLCLLETNGGVSSDGDSGTDKENDDLDVQLQPPQRESDLF